MARNDNPFDEPEIAEEMAYLDRKLDEFMTMPEQVANDLPTLQDFFTCLTRFIEISEVVAVELDAVKELQELKAMLSEVQERIDALKGMS